MKKMNILALILCLTMMSACSDKESEETVAPETTPPPIFETLPPETETETPAPTESVAPAINTEEYLESITFLGDSTTYGLRAYSMLDGGTETTQVWTPASGTLTISNQSFATIVYPETGEEISIRDAVELKKPEVMVITLGVNGVSFLTEDGFTAEYRSLVSDIQSISPDTRIVMHSIYPVQSDYQYIADINNEKITAANGWIKALANELGATYIDTYSLLLDETGYLNPAYGNGDGIHLGSAGFEIVLENLANNPV